MPNALNAWFDHPGLLHVRRDDLDFYLPPSERRDSVIALLGRIDSALLASQLTKNTRNTNAGIVHTGEGSLFIKRSNGRGPQHSLRYLFRPARVFRAAAAALTLHAAGIPTPRVYGAGERRRGRLLKCSYLVTEALTGTVSLERLLDADPSPDWLDQAGSLAGRLHASGVYHGDMKFTNLYRLDDRLGVWDLDGVRLFAAPPPPALACRELGRILSSFIIQADRQSRLPDAFFRLAPHADRLLDAYRRHARQAPGRAAVIDAALRRWLRRAPLRHRIDGLC